eukprot:Nitzschia sp. Nitz4//scaffold9_size221794//126716//127990//NITZ4_001359-RA/size221794-snap-gene-0.187-mRNA-1//-1//CDS//3329561040//8543//frame0
MSQASHFEDVAAAAAVAKTDSASSSTRNHAVEEEFDVGVTSPLWTQDGWSLTWPIWHLLSLQERKQLANQHGYKTIGEFEEYMSLHQAMDDSEAKPYPNTSIYSSPSSEAVSNLDSKMRAQPTPSKAIPEEDEEEESDDPDELENCEREILTGEELLQIAGQILILPDELLHQVFAWLPVDTYGVLAQVSPHWKHLTRTEAVYKRLCERLYLHQSKRRQLHVSRFNGSYRTMLEERPRVRVAGGCYVLKYRKVKKIQRDMWTEVPHGAILESVYYRYLYFQEDGRVLYALTSAPPHEMFRRMLRVILRRVEDPAAVWGTFQVQKNDLTISARQAWHHVKFNLTIQTQSMFGRFAALTMDRHLSSPSGCFEDWSDDRVEYEVPEEPFRFIKSGIL